MKKGTALVLDAIAAKMESQGWPLLTICDLPPSYAKDILVTPYFFCSNVSKRPFGNYIIEGLIGVIHQGFERLWVENPARQPKEPGFGVGLHIANFRDLDGKFYLPCDAPFAKEVDDFCTVITSILKQMPSDERQLVHAFEKDELYGFRIEDFAGYSHRNKFQAFREFLLS